MQCQSIQISVMDLHWNCKVIIPAANWWVAVGAEGHLEVQCGAEAGEGWCLVMLAAQVSAPKARYLVFTHQGKAGVPPVGCAFKVTLLPATVQRSKKERRLFPRILKDTHHAGPLGGGTGFNDHFG